MNLKINPSYKPCLFDAVCLQVGLQVLIYLVERRLFLFALIPVAAYWVITPIVIFRHPQPTMLDLQMVRTGYIFYFLLNIFAGILFTALRR